MPHCWSRPLSSTEYASLFAGPSLSDTFVAAAFNGHFRSIVSLFDRTYAFQLTEADAAGFPWPEELLRHNASPRRQPRRPRCFGSARTISTNLLRVIVVNRSACAVSNGSHSFCTNQFACASFTDLQRININQFACAASTGLQSIIQQFAFVASTVSHSYCINQFACTVLVSISLLRSLHRLAQH